MCGEHRAADDLPESARHRCAAGERVAQSINGAARELHGDHVVLLDASVRVITPQWLQVMFELSQIDDVAAVGALLRYPDGRLRTGHRAGTARGRDSVDQLLRVIKEASAVSGACLMTRREVFDKRGVSTDFHRRPFDVDYCMRVRQLGLRVLCTPLAELTWGEAERGPAPRRERRDATGFANDGDPRAKSRTRM